MVTKFDDGDVRNMAALNMSQLLSLALIGLVVDKVALLVSINDLVHLLFPDENHIDYVSFELLARLHVLVHLSLVESFVIIIYGCCLLHVWCFSQECCGAVWAF